MIAVSVNMLMPIFYVLLRVPPLFIMDSILNGSFLLFLFPEKQLSAPTTLSDNEALLLSVFAALSWLVFLLFCYACSCIMFVLSAHNLVHTYNFLISLGILIFSYAWNIYMLTSLDTILRLSDVTSSRDDVIAASDGLEVDIMTYLRKFVINVLLQCLLAYSYNCLRGDVSVGLVHSPINPMTYFSFLMPSVVKILPLPSSLCSAAVYSICLPASQLLLYFCQKLPVIYLTISEGIVNVLTSFRTIGIQGLIEGNWVRLNIPDVLRSFWTIRASIQCVLLISVRMMANFEMTGDYSINWNDCVDIFKTLMVNGCDTHISLLGMTSVVSYVTHYIGVMFARFISLAEEENPNMSAVSATLFFLLALQTGLTSLDPEKRQHRLYRNFWLLTTAIFHLLHTMVNPVLMSLSASHVDSLRKHVRALLVCLLLIILPAWLLYHLWTYHSTSTWMLAVTAFSVEVMVKVIVSLSQYTLFIIDSSRETFWEQLDDYVWYIRSTGSTIEFLFGIFLFCNGGFILFFESGGMIRACMMCIHAYYNIWVQAKDGWKTFIRRRTAVNKIQSLPLATPEQLSEHNDVCAICYQELLTGRITHCQHYFHGVCLRKWLYVQDRCPLCHQVIHVPDTPKSDEHVALNTNENHPHQD